MLSYANSVTFNTVGCDSRTECSVATLYSPESRLSLCCAKSNVSPRRKEESEGCTRRAWAEFLPWCWSTAASGKWCGTGCPAVQPVARRLEQTTAKSYRALRLLNTNRTRWLNRAELARPVETTSHGARISLCPAPSGRWIWSVELREPCISCTT